MKSVLPALLLIVVLYSSCKKINESIDRDIKITPVGQKVSFPIIDNTRTVYLLSDMSVTIDVNDLLQKATGDEFNSDNIRSITLSALKIVLENPDSLNNFRNLESLNFQIDTLTLAGLTNNPDSPADSISIPIQASTIELKELVKSTIKYRVNGIARKPTTRVISATIIPTYKVSLSR